MKGVYFVMVLMQYICTGTSTKGTIMSTSSSRPGVYMIPHCRSSYLTDLKWQLGNDYLNTESVKLSQNTSQDSWDHKGNDMKEAYCLLKFVYWVLNNHLDEYSEPECIELRHVVKESCQKAHELADFCLWWFFQHSTVNLVIWQAEILNIELLDQGIDLICRL